MSQHLWTACYWLCMRLRNADVPNARGRRRGAPCARKDAREVLRNKKGHSGEKAEAISVVSRRRSGRGRAGGRHAARLRDGASPYIGGTHTHTQDENAEEEKELGRRMSAWTSRRRSERPCAGRAFVRQGRGVEKHTSATHLHFRAWRPACDRKCGGPASQENARGGAQCSIAHV